MLSKGYSISDKGFIDKILLNTQKSPNAFVFLSSNGKEASTRNEIYQYTLLITNPTTKLNASFNKKL